MSYYLCPLYAPLLFLPISSFLLFADKAGVKEVVSRKKYMLSLNTVSVGVSRSILNLFSVTLLLTLFKVQTCTGQFLTRKFYIHRTKNMNVYQYTNKCTQKQYKSNIKINPTCFGVLTPSSGGLQVLSAKVMNY